jgi:gluconolactonase
MRTNPLKNWHVDRSSIQFIGQDLQRPECILAEPDGTVWTADARGGVVKLGPDGSQTLVTPLVEGPSTVSFEDRYVQAQGSLPNGLCFTPSGDFFIANWGTDSLEVMTRDGKLKTLYTEIDGQPLGKTNFPLRDSRGRI